MQAATGSGGGAATDPTGLEASLAAWRAADAAGRRGYLAWLGRRLETERALLHARLVARSEERAAAARRTANRALALLHLLALGLLLVPLWLWRRSAGRRRQVVQASVLAFVLVTLGLLVSNTLLVLLLGASSEATRGLDPQHAMLDAGLDMVGERIQEALQADADAAALPIGPTLKDLRENPAPDFLSQLFDNLRYLDVGALRFAAQALQIGYRLMEQLPHVLPFLVVVLFLLTLRDVLAAVVRLPWRVAAGQEGATGSAIRRLFGGLGREFLAVLGAVLVLIGLAASLHLAVRILAMASTRLGLEAAQALALGMGRLTGEPDPFLVSAGALAVPAFLGLGLALAAFGTVAITIWARRVFRLRFHRRVPLRAHAGFAGRAVLAAARLHWLPAIVATGALVASDAGAFAADRPDAAAAFSALSALAVALGAGLVVAGVALRVPQSLWWLLRFRPQRPARDDRRPPQAPPA